MFDISWSHILIVGTVAVVVIGPKELPATMRSLGRGINKLRRMAGEFQGQFNEAIKEANLEDVKKEFDVLRQSAASLTSVSSPLGLARNALTSSIFQEDPSKTTSSSSPTMSPLSASSSLSHAPIGASEKESTASSDKSPSVLAALEGVDIPSAFAPLAAFKR